MAEAHPPHRARPPEITLLPDSIVRDVATGEALSSEEWLTVRVQRESRSRDECVDELMNAIARGDLVVEGD